jgi:YD repeat-containing protein
VSADDSENKTLSFRYDSLGRLLSETRAGATVSYRYDALGNVTDMTYPSGRTVHRDIDPLGRFASVSTDSAAIADYAHDGLLLDTKRLANGVSEKYAYDSLLRLNGLAVKKQDATPIFSRALSYDHVGNIVSDGQNTYGYDTLYALTHAHYGETGENESFGYDPAGNRETTGGKQGNLSYATNELNQYTSVAPATGSGKILSYDRNGNVTDDGTHTFVYDYRNRIVEVSKKEETIVVPVIPEAPVAPSDAPGTSGSGATTDSGSGSTAGSGSTNT